MIKALVQQFCGLLVGDHEPHGLAAVAVAIEVKALDQPVSEQRMILRPLLGGHGFYEAHEGPPVASGTGFNEIDE